MPIDQNHDELPVDRRHILCGGGMRVVIDSYQFAVAPSKKAEAVDIQHFGWGSAATSRLAGP